MLSGFTYEMEERDKADIFLHRVFSMPPQVSLGLLLPLKTHNLDKTRPLGY